MFAGVRALNFNRSFLSGGCFMKVSEIHFAWQRADNRVEVSSGELVPYS